MSAATQADLAALERRGEGPWPTQAAFNTAHRLGGAGDVDALGLIVERRDVSLFVSFAQAWEGSGNLPPAMEPIVVRALADEKLRDEAHLLFRSCQRRYQSREVFEGLYVALKNADTTRRQSDIASAIVCTSNLKIDVELAAVLPKLSSYAAVPLLQFLGRTKSAAAVDSLRQIIERKSNEPQHHVDRALLEIGTPEAIAVLVKRFAWLGEHPKEPYASSEGASLVFELSKKAPAFTLPYEQVHPVAIFALRNQTFRRSFLDLIRKTGQREAIPDMLGVLDASDPYATQIVDAILELGSANDWRNLQQTTERFPDTFWNSEYRQKMRKRIDYAAGQPLDASAKRDARQRDGQLAARRASLKSEAANLAPLKATDPERYARESAANLDRQVALVVELGSRPDATGPVAELLQAYSQLAGFVRFTLKDPRRAQRLYERGIAVGNSVKLDVNGGVTLLRLGLADVQRFELGQGSIASATYRDILAQQTKRKQSSNDIQAGLDRLLGDWLAAEVAFLDRGIRYAGRPQRDSVESMAMVLAYGQDAFVIDNPPLAAIAAAKRAHAPSVGERPDMQRMLESLAPSSANLLGAFVFLPLLDTSDRIVAFARRHDPTGYLTACLFLTSALVDDAIRQSQSENRKQLQGSEVFGWSDAERALLRNAGTRLLGSATMVAKVASSATRSPTATWQTFMSALKAGNLDEAWPCMTSGMRNRLEPEFKQMSRAQLKAMADSFVEFGVTSDLGAMQEAVVKRSDGRASFVYFHKVGDEWRIDEM